METLTRPKATLTLPSDREMLITRDFDAPRRLVFEAWTRPELVRRWYGCAAFAMSVCEIDLRVGGGWRFVLNDPGTGMDHGFSGEYREIAAPERLVYTERYEPIPGSDHLVTLTFTEQAGRTTLTEHLLHASRENRDGHLQSGMEEGMQQTLDRLEELVEELARKGG